MWVFAVLYTVLVYCDLICHGPALQGFDATWKQPGKLGKRASHAFGAQTGGKKLENNRTSLLIVMGHGHDMNDKT